MAFSSEITGKLGIDTSSVPADLAKAKNAFQQFGSEVQNEAQKHGEGAGDKLTHALEHKLLGARHLSGALATALGLNIEHIAETVAGAIVGGSKEAWEEAVKLADENTKVIERLIETRMSPKQIQDKRQKDLTRAVEESHTAGQQTEVGQAVEKLGFFGTNLKLIGQAFGLIKTDAQRLNETQKSTLHVSEADLKNEEDKKKVREAELKLNEALDRDATENLTSSQKIVALQEYEKKIIEEINSGKLSELQIIEKQNELREASKKIQAEELAIAQRKEDKERALTKLAVERFETQRKTNRDEQALADAKGDRSKLTVGELAHLQAGRATQDNPSVSVDTFGLSDAAGAAKQKAAEIEQLQGRAEQLRRSGDALGANAAFETIDSKRDELVSSGFLKASEGDQFRQLKETLHKDFVESLKIAAETNTILQGKYVNQ